MLFFLESRLLAASAHPPDEVLEKSDDDDYGKDSEQEQNDDQESKGATNGIGERDLGRVECTGHNGRGSGKDTVKDRDHNGDEDRNDHKGHDSGDDDLGKPFLGPLIESLNIHSSSHLAMDSFKKLLSYKTS